MLYLVNKILLLKQLILGGKKIALIDFAFLHDFTAFTDIPVFVKYLFLRKARKEQLKNQMQYGEL